MQLWALTASNRNRTGIIQKRAQLAAIILQPWDPGQISRCPAQLLATQRPQQPELRIKAAGKAIAEMHYPHLLWVEWIRTTIKQKFYHLHQGSYCVFSDTFDIILMYLCAVALFFLLLYASPAMYHVPIPGVLFVPLGTKCWSTERVTGISPSC